MLTMFFWKWCQLCDPNCGTCNGPKSNNCLSCNPGLYYDSISKTCYCNSACLTCDGPNANNCLSCNPGLYYQQSIKQCVKSCNKNQFPNQLQWCQSCDISCASCDGSTPNNCLSCNPNSYFYNKSCVNPCPNGYQSNSNTLNCDLCQNYWSPQCNLCDPTCQLCNQSQIQSKQCNTCYGDTRKIDSNNKCVCKNQNDQRNIFYQCSYQNIAVVDAKLSATAPMLTIDLGSPLMNIIANSPQSLCQQIFDYSTLNIIGLDSQCSISGSQILVNLSNSSTIMENNPINFLPNKLQFKDYSSVFINVFYRNITYQVPPGTPQLQFTYNRVENIENSCNPINITLINIQNDAGRKFMNLNWTLNQTTGTISKDQLQTINNIILQANQSQITSLVFDPKLLPPNISITIIFSYLLKVNQTGTQIFTITYQKSKIIRVQYQQSLYPPIYRQKCELGQITYFNEPFDIQLVPNQLQKLNLNQYSQSNFQYDITPYSIAPSQTFSFIIILNLSFDSLISTIQKVSVNIQVSDLYLKIIGGSNLVLGYRDQMVLNTQSRDYEIQDVNSAQNITFSWNCSSLSSNDHICYDYQNNQIQLQQGNSNITFPANTFSPYSILQFTVIGKKDSRQSSFTTTCLFTELNIPPLNIQMATTNINGKVNLNDDLNFQITYGQNIQSDQLSYAGAMLYDNNPVASIKFDYSQIRFRIWNYFSNIDPLKPTLQIRFSVYSPLFVMPSSSIISIQINIPPQNCVLSINPLQGIALQTIFQIQLLNCTDQDQPLTYQFFYYNSADDAHQELVSPWNILRRQIQDQTINNSILTILPQGNLVVMVQAMDSYLGIYNTSSIVQVQAQNKSAEEYYYLANLLTTQALQSSNNYVTNQLVTLSIIAEDLSKNNQLSQDFNDLESKLIQNIQQMSLQIPKFSLLSTFANKVVAQLSLQFFNSSYSNNLTTQKNQIFTSLQTILQNTNSSIQSNNISHLQQNNDIQIQNLVDSFKILNSSIILYGNNSQQDFQQYDQISSQIGNLLNNISLPNQGQMILNGSLSTLVLDKVTQKNLFKYVLSINDQNSQNQTNLFNILINNYQQNIYENTSEFFAYTQLFKNINKNFTYTKNELISPQIYNSSFQQALNQSTILYQFNNTNFSKLYNMICLQQNNIQWSKQNCDIHKITQSDYVCLCGSQLPTTIIEDFDDFYQKYKNPQTYGEEGFNITNFYMYVAFWLLLSFTLIQTILFIIGKIQDKYSVKIKYSKVYSLDLNALQKNECQQFGDQQQYDKNNQNICDIELLHDPPFIDQFRSNEDFKPDIQQNEQIFSPFDQKIDQQSKRRKRQKFINFLRQQTQRSLKQSLEQNIETNEDNADQLQSDKQQSSNKSVEKFKTMTSSQSQINEVYETQKINVYLQFPKAKKLAIFHQFFSIFYIFDDALSRPLRFTLLYLKTIHTLAISMLFQGYNMLIQQVIIALINSSVMKVVFFGIIFTFKKGSKLKVLSLILQIGIGIVCYYFILAVSNGKTPSESNQFIILFIISFLTEMVITELIKSFCMILLIKKYINSNQPKNIFGKLQNFFDLKQTILNIES